LYLIYYILPISFKIIQHEYFCISWGQQVGDFIIKHDIVSENGFYPNSVFIIIF